MLNAFTVFAVGVLARNPEVFKDNDNETVAKFCLVGNDFDEIDGAVREFVTSVWFFASDPVATALRRCRKGDQLIVEGRIVASNVVVEKARTDYDYAFDVIAFGLEPGKEVMDHLPLVTRHLTIHPWKVVRKSRWRL